MKGISSPADVCKLIDVVVFNASITTVDTWQDLDLSAHIGANVGLCFFEITNVGTVHLRMKPKGYGSLVPGDHSLAGVAAMPSQPTAKYTYLICCTNNEGIIEIASDDDNPTITIRLFSVIK